MPDGRTGSWPEETPVITGTVSYTTAIGGSNTVLAARLWTEAEKDQFAELVKKYAKKVR